MDCIEPNDLQKTARRYGIPLVVAGGLLGALVNPTAVWACGLIAIVLVFVVEFLVRQRALPILTAQIMAKVLIGIIFTTWVAWFAERFLL